MTFDTLVLGAGIVGVCTAVHLQRRGQRVVLVDRKAPGNETSFGNAGLIQAEGVYPYALPRELRTLLRYAGNRLPDVRYHPDALPRVLPFLWRYWRNSHPQRHAAIAQCYATLIRESVAEHRALARAAGAEGLIRQGGWMRVFRTREKHWEAIAESERARQEFGIPFEALDSAGLRAAEPDLDPSLAGAVRYVISESTVDPHALVSAYARYFEALGGLVVTGDATTLSGAWRVETEVGPVAAKSAVIALGPWSDTLTQRLGYRLPLAVKRGYHMHYAAKEGARLNHPVLDAERGYLLAPMTRGIRLTTGAEFARRDAPRTPDQLEAVEPIARTLFPLAGRLDAEPWMGSRPCTPDMLPIIGPAPAHAGLWFAFGHAHHGLTLGPATGRLLAEMMTGAEPFADPKPFRADRF